MRAQDSRDSAATGVGARGVYANVTDAASITGLVGVAVLPRPMKAVAIGGFIILLIKARGAGRRATALTAAISLVIAGQLWQVERTNQREAERAAEAAKAHEDKRAQVLAEQINNRFDELQRAQRATIYL